MKYKNNKILYSKNEGIRDKQYNVKNHNMDTKEASW